MNSPETLSKFAYWRTRAAAGELTIDEMREAILALREGRSAAAESATTKKRKAAIAAIPSAADMLSELKDL